MRQTIWPAVALLCALVVAMTGCSSPLARPEPTVVVGTGETPVGRVVSAIYLGALAHTGIKVVPSAPEAQPAQMNGLVDGSVDLVAGFSGELLHQLAPQSTAVSSDDVYKELNRALPQGVYAGDLTAVTTAGLADKPEDENAVAQVLVPLYRAAVFPKKAIVAMNNIAGELTSGDLAALVTSVEHGQQAPAAAANRWLADHGL